MVERMILVAAPAAATVTEDGAPVEVEYVLPARVFGAERDVMRVVLADGRRLSVEFPRPPASSPMGFVASGEDPPPARATLTGPPMSDVLPVLCSTDDGATGELLVRDIEWSDGFVSWIDATLTVRFESCIDTWEGRSLDGVTFVVELPGEG